MKILRKGPESTKITCNRCTSLLEIEPTDIKVVEKEDEVFGAVKCPVCDFINKINITIGREKFTGEKDFEYYLNWAKTGGYGCGGDMGLKYHSEKYKDSYEFCLHHVKIESRNLAFVPEKYRDYGMCIEAIKSFAAGFSKVYKKNIDSFSETYAENQMTIYLIPERIRTEKFVLEMLNIFKSYDKQRAFGWGDYIRFVPVENITKKLCLECVKYGADVNDLPAKFIDYDICKLCIESGGDMYDIEDLDVKDEVVTQLIDEGYLEKIEFNNGSYIIEVPDKYWRSKYKNKVG